jgi:hypothetical protein
VVRFRGTAVYFFLMFFAFSLPCIWFLCEPDWFSNDSLTISCWVWFLVAVWFVPTVSFIIDLSVWSTTPKPLMRHLKRSAFEVIVAFPIWVVVWGLFAIHVLEWGFI